MELDLIRPLRSPALEHPKPKGGEGADCASLFGVFEDLTAGVVFLFHVYTLPQMRQKASTFFDFF